MLERTYVEPRRKLEKFLDTPIEKISIAELARIFSISKDWKIVEIRDEIGVFGTRMLVITFAKV